MTGKDKTEVVELLSDELLDIAARVPCTDGCMDCLCGGCWTASRIHQADRFLLGGRLFDARYELGRTWVRNDDLQRCMDALDDLIDGEATRP